MKEIPYTICVGHINLINKAIALEKDYSQNLYEIITTIIKEELLEELYFNEFWALGYNCLYVMLDQSLIREEYEICSAIQNVIQNEEQIYKDWCLSLPDDEQAEYMEELEYLKLEIKNERDGKQ